jgi:hypothetical protein
MVGRDRSRRSCRQWREGASAWPSDRIHVRVMAGHAGGISYLHGRREVLAYGAQVVAFGCQKLPRLSHRVCFHSAIRVIGIVCDFPSLKWTPREESKRIDA